MDCFLPSSTSMHFLVKRCIERERQSREMRNDI
jgi:hypothetical protein